MKMRNNSIKFTMQSTKKHERIFDAVFLKNKFLKKNFDIILINKISSEIISQKLLHCFVRRNSSEQISIEFFSGKLRE